MFEEKKECDFCHTKQFEYWQGSYGLRGQRCLNKCMASYVIFTEPMMSAGFPKEKEKPRRNDINTKGKKRH